MAILARADTRIRHLRLGGIDVEVTTKKIKNIYLRVCAPDGAVKLSAPCATSAATIENFVVTRVDWIKKHQQKIHTRLDNIPQDWGSERSCYFQGVRYALRVVENSDPVSRVTLFPDEAVVEVTLGRRERHWQAVLERWYRQQLQLLLQPVLSRWEEKLQVRCARLQLRKMRSRWGSCTPATASIRVNLELVKRAPQCLEYVLVHELLHLLEPSHNRRFYALLEHHLPGWRLLRQQLNSIPLVIQH